MIQAVLELDQSVNFSESAECLAIKLLEVIILQCIGMDIDGKISTFVNAIIQRMTRDMESSKAKVMCIQVIIAALYYSPTIFLNTMDKLHIPKRSVFAYVLSQWFNSIDYFLGAHSRKMCVIGLAHLIQMSDNPSVVSYAQHIVPSALKIFQGLKRAHAVQNGKESIEREDANKDNDEQLMIESEDELEDERIFKNGTKAADNPVNVSGTMSLDDDIDIDEEEADLEAFITPLDNSGVMDEFSLFKEVLEGIKCSNPAWYTRLTENLSEIQMKTLSEVVSSVKIKTDARDSKEKFKFEKSERSHNVPGYPRNIG